MWDFNRVWFLYQEKQKLNQVLSDFSDTSSVSALNDLRPEQLSQVKHKCFNGTIYKKRKKEKKKKNNKNFD